MSKWNGVQRHAKMRKKEITDAATVGRKLEKTEKPIRVGGCSVTLPEREQNDVAPIHKTSKNNFIASPLVLYFTSLQEGFFKKLRCAPCMMVSLGCK